MRSFVPIVIFLYIQCSRCFIADEIQLLPGLAYNVSFRQYSGYLNGGQDIHIHYWFVESQSNPETDPVILWLNGGPGMSSLFGLFTENGPFRVGSDGQTVTTDLHSWNTLANVLYLESPVGVGYSYKTINSSIDLNFDSDKTFIITDETTAQTNLIALEDFFGKFPHLSANPFYMAGESYAGVYIPTLAIKIFRQNSNINLKGVAIGNGLLNTGDPKLQFYLYLSHGLVSIDAFNLAVKRFCQCDNNVFTCSDSPINRNYPAPIISYKMFKDEFNVLSDCPINLNDNNGSDSKNSSDTQNNKCPTDMSTVYLNRPEVRSALHIPDYVQRWTPTSGSRYFASFRNMSSEFEELIGVYNLTNIIIFSGDLDMTEETNFLANQKFVDELECKLKDKYHPWYVGGRIGGFVKRYEGITFTTVRGAGHMVPKDQPEAALEVVKELIGLKTLN